MADFKIPWTDGNTLSLTVPDKNLHCVISAPELEDLGDPAMLVEQAMQDPLGCPPLEIAARGCDRVTILVTDTMDTYMSAPHNLGPMLLDRFNCAGITDERISVVHSAGMHGHFGAKERLGENWLRRVNYIEHHPGRETDLDYRGTTRLGTPVWVNKAVSEADYTIGIGGCAPSLFGFHGGAGVVLPGAAGRDTIRHNHTYILMDRPITAWGPGNPQREDVQEAGDLAGFDMKVDFTANAVFAGYHRVEWPIAVEYYEQVAMTEMEIADIYILGIGNSTDLGSLYMQIEMAQQATAENGAIVVVISAHEQPDVSDWSEERALQTTLTATDVMMNRTGSELDDDAGQLDSMAKFRLMQLPLDRLAQILSRREGEPRSTCMAWSHRRAIERRHTILVTQMEPIEASLYGFAAATTSFDEALDLSLRHTSKQARITVNAPVSGFALLPHNRSVQ